MPIDAEVLAAHIEVHGPYLFHVTDAKQREAILRDGLRPGSDIGRQVWDDFFRTRVGRVYLCDRRRGVPVVVVEGERLTLQVDLRRLDPACFDTEPPKREMLDQYTAADGQAGRLAAWAESIEEFDEPEFAARSLAAGRVAYRGTIPP